MNYSKDIIELVESWMYGNRTWVREQAKKLRKPKLARLTMAISEIDSPEQAHKFIDGMGIQS